MLRRFEFTVQDEPKPLGRPRFARIPGGKVRTYMPRKDQDVRFNIRSTFLMHVDGDFEPLAGPLRLTMAAWLPIPRSIPKKRQEAALPSRRPDLDNYIKQVEDALLGYAYIDDSQIVTIEARKRYAGPFPGRPAFPCWSIILDEIQSL